MGRPPPYFAACSRTGALGRRWKWLDPECQPYHFRPAVLVRELPVTARERDKAVDDLIGLVPSNHGTTTPLAPYAGDAGCVACDQQIAGSELLAKLNAGDETPGSISYTQVTTRNDEVVTPYRSAYLEPGPRTTNVTVQDRCPLDFTEHLGIIYDPVALQWVINALERAGAAAPNFRPRCL